MLCYVMRCDGYLLFLGTLVQSTKRAFRGPKRAGMGARPENGGHVSPRVRPRNEGVRRHETRDHHLLPALHVVGRVVLPDNDGDTKRKR